MAESRICFVGRTKKRPSKSNEMVAWDKADMKAKFDLSNLSKGSTELKQIHGCLKVWLKLDGQIKTPPKWNEQLSKG